VRTPFQFHTFLPTNKVAWGIITITLFSLPWFPPFDVLSELSKESFNPNAGGGVTEGVQVVIAMSLVLFCITSMVGWGIQGVCVAAFRRWIFPRLESRYHPGVSFGYIMNPRRLWVSRWFRSAIFISAACLIVLVSGCAFFRVWRLSDLEAYRGMAAECHPVWRAFAFRKFSRGDSAAELLAKYPPTQREEFGRYGVYHYGHDMGYTGLTVTTKDGRLMTAGAWSCTWRFTFFDTVDPQLVRDHAVFMQERRGSVTRK
jgi:hypothetical protein